MDKLIKINEPEFLSLKSQSYDESKNPSGNARAVQNQGLRAVYHHTDMGMGCEYDIPEDGEENEDEDEDENAIEPPLADGKFYKMEVKL